MELPQRGQASCETWPGCAKWMCVMIATGTCCSCPLHDVVDKLFRTVVSAIPPSVREVFRSTKTHSCVL
jgi:hypothetical protein